MSDCRGVSLFVYGSLELLEVMHAVAGRDFKARHATLAGHRRRLIRGEVYPGIVADSGESVRGVLYQGLVEADLCVLDHFEGEPYRREPVKVTCGETHAVDAYTYVLRDQHAELLTDLGWDVDRFRRLHLEDFLATCGRFRTGLAAGTPNRRSIG